VNNLILILDDSPTIRTIIQMTLQSNGYSGISFADGTHALRWLNHHADMQPGLIFLDVNMPRIDGYEWARRVKSQPRFHNTAIVLMSSGATDRIKPRMAGITDYLAKPFTTQTILTTVKTYLPPPAQLRVESRGETIP
jgi:CheY-like chemotaxis protein